MKFTPQLLDVSRETNELLQDYENLVRKWTEKINLVSKNSLEAFKTRHVVDSAQCFDYMKNTTGLVLDIGSGAGLPGIVVAILCKEKAPDQQVCMIESDQRKSAFLRTACRELGLNAKVVNKRIEDVPGQAASYITSRALAPLNALLYHVDRHIAKDGVALLHKGKNWKTEVHEAKLHWHFDLQAHTSKIDDDSVILEIRNVRHV